MANSSRTIEKKTIIDDHDVKWWLIICLDEWVYEKYSVNMFTI